MVVRKPGHLLRKERGTENCVSSRKKGLGQPLKAIPYDLKFKTQKALKKKFQVKLKIKNNTIIQYEKWGG